VPRPRAREGLGRPVTCAPRGSPGLLVAPCSGQPPPARAATARECHRSPRLARTPGPDERSQRCAGHYAPRTIGRPVHVMPRPIQARGNSLGTLSGPSRALCSTGADTALVRDECATMSVSDILARNWTLHHRTHVNALGHTWWRPRLAVLFERALRTRASVARSCRVCAGVRTYGHCRRELQDIGLLNREANASRS
jgi:hypothetical protein